MASIRRVKLNDSAEGKQLLMVPAFPHQYLFPGTEALCEIFISVPFHQWHSILIHIPLHRVPLEFWRVPALRGVLINSVSMGVFTFSGRLQLREELFQHILCSRRLTERTQRVVFPALFLPQPKPYSHALCFSSERDWEVRP